MNLAGITTTLGLVTLAVITMPFGIVILIGMAYLYRKG